MAKGNAGEKPLFATFPSGFVKVTELRGRECVRVICPDGVRMGGVSLGGMSFIRPLTASVMERLANGRPVTFAFDRNRAVELWDPGTKSTISIDSPWKFVRAVAREREEYREAVSEKTGRGPAERKSKGARPLRSEMEAGRAASSVARDAQAEGLVDYDFSANGGFSMTSAGDGPSLDESVRAATDAAVVMGPDPELIERLTRSLSER